MPKHKLDQTYAQIMENHPFGVALYKPPPSSTFQPGMCGYWDEFTGWNPICNLLDAHDLENRGLGALEQPLERAPLESNIKWGPMTSTDTKSHKIDLTAGVWLSSSTTFRAPQLGLPITASVLYEYSTDSDNGAILLTQSPIIHDRFYFSTPFKNWVKSNAHKILDRFPDVRDHQLWIVTSVYMTKSCSINLWNGKGKTFKIGFSVDGTGVGQAGAGYEWHHSHKDEGWQEYSPSGDENSVVFFGGFVFQYHRSFLKKKEELRQQDLAPLFEKGLFRGGRRELTSFADPTEPDESIVVSYGEVFEETDMISDDEEDSEGE